MGTGFLFFLAQSWVAKVKFWHRRLSHGWLSHNQDVGLRRSNLTERYEGFLLHANMLSCLYDGGNERRTLLHRRNTDRVRFCQIVTPEGCSDTLILTQGLERAPWNVKVLMTWLSLKQMRSRLTLAITAPVHLQRISKNF